MSEYSQSWGEGVNLYFVMKGFEYDIFGTVIFFKVPLINTWLYKKMYKIMRSG